MLNEFCKYNDLDMLMLQEVMHTNFDNIQNRNVYINVGTERRGTAIITKEHMVMTGIERLFGERDRWVVSKYVHS
jgi:hypothetical protein